MIGMIEGSDMEFVIPQIGDIVWAWDSSMGMKIPLVVFHVYEDGTWDGRVAWRWGYA